MVLGIVTENIDSATVLEAVEDITTTGQKRTIQYQRVVTYGVAVLLAFLVDWLDERVPSYASMGEREARRQPTALG